MCSTVIKSVLTLLWVYCENYLFQCWYWLYAIWWTSKLPNRVNSGKRDGSHWCEQQLKIKASLLVWTILTKYCINASHHIQHCVSANKEKKEATKEPYIVTYWHWISYADITFSFQTVFSQIDKMYAEDTPSFNVINK